MSAHLIADPPVNANPASYLQHAMWKRHVSISGHLVSEPCQHIKESLIGADPRVSYAGHLGWGDMAHEGLVSRLTP